MFAINLYHMKSSTPVPEWLIFLVLIVVAFIIGLGNKAKKTKQDLAERYHIDRKTLAKWIEHFQTDILLENWNSKRKLTSLEYLKLTNTFGTDTSLVSNKKSLIAVTGSTYKV